MGHVLLAKLWGCGAIDGPMIGMGGIDGAGITGSREVAGSHSTPGSECRNGNNASTGDGVSLPGHCDQCSGNSPVSGTGLTRHGSRPVPGKWPGITVG